MPGLPTHLVHELNAGTVTYDFGLVFQGTSVFSAI